MARLLLALLLAILSLITAPVRAAEVLPPVPAHYFNDYAGVVSKPIASALDRKLEQLERDTSNQIVVTVYPKMQSDSDIADYTFRVKETWHVGQKSKNNGAVLFVFVQERKAYIQTNYGLEGALPDATCKQIIDKDISPLLAKGDYDTGLTLGVASMVSATRGEYHGDGRISSERAAREISHDLWWIIGGLIAFSLLGIGLLVIHNCGGTFYDRHRRSLGIVENVYLFLLNIGLNVVTESSSSSSSGSSGFSGGGGTGGGGGAGGSW
ncbi:MAG TPA: TPM domain-containing protein [Tepidisphaeraceae bacterium]|nr:TPM domain-containing protein [Tepidisphaeraceae bacterium]